MEYSMAFLYILWVIVIFVVYFVFILFKRRINLDDIEKYFVILIFIFALGFAVFLK